MNTLQNKYKRDSCDYLLDEAAEIENKVLREACQFFLAEEHFQNSQGGVDHHHAFAGGLVCHTAEVLRCASALASCYFNTAVDMDVLRTAAILHDFDKTKDYKGNEKQPYKKLVGHVAGSVASLCWYLGYIRPKKSEMLEFDTLVKIQHAMLAHHGRQEWGSPVEPQTIEAHILHYADMMSSRFGVSKSWRNE